MKLIARYLWNFVVLFDQACNTVLGGSPNETLSERSAKARNAGRRWGCVLCAFLDWINPMHCDNSMKSTIGDDAVIPDGD